MSAAVIAQLLAQYGLPLTQQIYVWVKENKTVVTPEDWALLEQLAKYRSNDALTAAGNKIEDGTTPMSRMETEQLVEELKKVSARLDGMTDTRHKGNEALNAIILQFTEQTERHETRIQTMETTINRMIQTLASDLRDIKTRLIGDAALQSDGLVQQHNGVITRLVVVEQKADKNRDDLNWIKRERIVVFSVIAGAGSVLAWIKGWFT